MSWRAQVERQVRTRKQCEPAGAHILEGPDGETCHNIERMQVSKGHLQTGEPR